MRRFANSGGGSPLKINCNLPPALPPAPRPRHDDPWKGKPGLNPRRADLGIYSISRDASEATLLGAQFFFTTDRLLTFLLHPVLEPAAVIAQAYWIKYMAL
jgi:hypothetical protein